MKITLDISRLVEEGRLTSEERAQPRSIGTGHNANAAYPNELIQKAAPMMNRQVLS
jgi:hypothetical protein